VATGYKAEGRAEGLEEGTIVKVDEDGDIKAFPVSLEPLTLINRDSDCVQIVCCTFIEIGGRRLKALRDTRLASTNIK
jgi:hypothetical protein